MGADDLARHRQVPAVGESGARCLHPRVGEAAPQALGVRAERGRGLQGLGRQRVLVVDVGRAEGLEGSRVAAAERGDQVGVDGHAPPPGPNSGRPASGVEASA